MQSGDPVSRGSGTVQKAPEQTPIHHSAKAQKGPGVQLSPSALGRKRSIYYKPVAPPQSKPLMFLSSSKVVLSPKAKVISHKHLDVHFALH